MFTWKALLPSPFPPTLFSTYFHLSNEWCLTCVHSENSPQFLDRFCVWRLLSWEWSQEFCSVALLSLAIDVEHEFWANIQMRGLKWFGSLSYGDLIAAQSYMEEDDPPTTESTTTQTALSVLQPWGLVGLGEASSRQMPIQSSLRSSFWYMNRVCRCSRTENMSYYFSCIFNEL